jgi:hypothetical protein
MDVRAGYVSAAANASAERIGRNEPQRHRGTEKTRAEVKECKS